MQVLFACAGFLCGSVKPSLCKGGCQTKCDGRVVVTKTGRFVNRPYGRTGRASAKTEIPQSFSLKMTALPGGAFKCPLYTSPKKRTWPVRDRRVSVLRKKHCNLKVTVLLMFYLSKVMRKPAKGIIKQDFLMKCKAKMHYLFITGRISPSVYSSNSKSKCIASASNNFCITPDATFLMSHFNI